jgi:hypothetical protein
VIAVARYYLIRAASPTPSPHPSHSRSVPHPVHTAGGTPFSILNPTWITALATAGLLIGAIVTAFFAFLAFRKQSAEVTLLKDQAGRDIEQRRRSQAAKVFVWVVEDLASGSGMFVRIRNASEQPVYDLEFSADGMGPVRSVPPGGAPCMPGESHSFATAALGDDAAAAPPVQLDFRDAAGLRWRTTSRGELTEVLAPAPPTA